MGICPLRCDQFTVPRQDRVGGHNGGDLAQNPPAKWLSFGRQSATLVVGETQASPIRFELLFQDAVFFDQVSDHGRLLATDPAGERGQQELELDVFKHSGSVSDQREVVLFQHDRIFGHYEVINVAG